MGFAIDQWNPSLQYLATQNHGVWRSTDGGRTWVGSSSELPGLDTMAVDVILIDNSRPNHVFAAARGVGVIMSPDAGQTWRRLTPEISASGSQVTELLLGASGQNDVLYATTSGSILRSTDGGATWRMSRKPLDSGTIFSLKASPIDPKTVIAGTESGLIMSHDFGNHWFDCSGTLPHVPCSGFISSDGATMYAYGVSLGAMRSTDEGGTWTAADDGLGGSTVTNLATNETGDLVYAALGGAVAVHDPHHPGWISSGPGLPGDTIIGITVDNGNAALAVVATTFGAYRTANSGRSWSTLSHSFPLTPDILEIHPHVRMRVFASGEPGLFASMDQGKTWAHTLPVTSSFGVRSFTFMQANAAIAYAATDRHGVIITTNGGLQWEEAKYGLTDVGIRLVTLDPNDQQIAYAWADDGMAYKTANQGLEWSRCGVPWKPGDHAIVISDRFVPSSVLALLPSSRLLRSSDGGATWRQAGDAGLVGEPTAFLWNDASSTLYIAFRHRGVFRIHVKSSASSTTTSSQDDHATQFQ
jgi:photosystem II stability/assembly factor-like uncharacterized protein